MKKTSKCFATIVLLMLCLAVSGSVFASATTAQQEGADAASARGSQEEDTLFSALGSADEATHISALTELLREAKVLEEDISVLIEKYKNEEPWDSFKEEYRDLAPQIVQKGYTRTTYPDGSFVEVTITNPESESHPRGRNYSYYTGVTATKNSVLVQLGFKIDYTVDHLLSASKITALYDKHIMIIGGTYSNLTSGHWPDYRDPTNGWLSADATLGPNVVSSYIYLKMFVDGYGNTWTEGKT